MLISEEYRNQCRLLHNLQAGWGEGDKREVIKQIQLAAMANTIDILDYGCGKGEFGKNYPWPIKEYDPGITGKEAGNVPAEFVICHDVLEHIEPEYLDNVLQDLHRCTLRVGYFAIGCSPAEAILPDGRNAHLIIKPASWWKEKLNKYFHLLSYLEIFKDVGKMISEAQAIIVPKKDIEC